MPTNDLGEPTTVAGRQLVADVAQAIVSISKETKNETVRIWMREVGSALVQTVRVGVILAEKEARNDA